MPNSAEVRRRDRRMREAEQIKEAAAVIRQRSPDGYAGLDSTSGEAAAQLLEEIAGQAREGTNPRVWASAARVAHYVLDPPGVAPVRGPLPYGYGRNEGGSSTSI